MNHYTKAHESKQKADLADLLLQWFEAHARDLPWRVPPERRLMGERSDPYHVWLSEIMLQQTTIVTVIPYFEKVLEKWPSIKALADAEREEILAAWAGLGYYRRAHKLHECANVIVNEYHGKFPKTAGELITLPGIGPYTSAAIAAIAFDEPAPVIDGNVERVFARVFEIDTPKGKLKNDVLPLLAQEVPQKRAGEFAESLMDLGATICKPRTPSCENCPLKDICQSFAHKSWEKYPIPKVKQASPLKYGDCFVVLASHDKILLEKRPDKGLLAGMLGLPTTSWLEKEHMKQNQPGFLADLQKKATKLGRIKHVFTHFELYLNVYGLKLDEHDMKAPSAASDHYVWHSLPRNSPETIWQGNPMGLPKLFVKALHQAGKTLHQTGKTLRED